MPCRVQKRITLRRKLHIVRALNSSNSAKRTSIANSTVLHLYKLKVMLETVKREYANLIATRREYLSLLKQAQQQKDVKVEKVRDGTFVIRVACEKGGDKLVAVLEAFDEMCLCIQQARVSCSNEFFLEAIAIAEDQTLDVKNVTKALINAIGN